MILLFKRAVITTCHTKNQDRWCQMCRKGCKYKANVMA